MATPLLEREQELGLLRERLAAARAGSGSVAVIEGPPGIGKSALLETLVDVAHADGCEVLSARASELERDFAFGVVHQLFDARLRAAPAPERQALLSGAAGLATIALDTPQAGGAPGDASFGVLYGLYWLTAAFAEQRTLVLAIDDLHWCDHASLRWIDFLARRGDELPILLLLTIRDDDGAHVGSLRRLPHAETLTPSPLSREAVAELMPESPAPELVDACHAATGGNPFHVWALLLAMDPSDSGGRALSRVTLSRLEALSPDAVALARAAAVLGDRAPLQLAARLAGLEPERAAAAADAMARADLAATSDPLVLAHPLVRSALYEALGDEERALAHGRAAALMEALGRPPDEIAAQLLRTHPAGREQTVSALRGAAAAALSGGAPETAVRYLARADVEPPDTTAVRAAVARELGVASLLAHDPAGVEHLQRAIALGAEPRFRAETARTLARSLLLMDELAPAADVLERALADLNGADDELALSLACDVVTITRVHRDPAKPLEQRVERLRRLLGGGGEVPASPAARLAVAQLAMVAAMGDGAASAAALVRRRSLAGICCARRPPTRRVRLRDGGARVRRPPRRRSATPGRGRRGRACPRLGRRLRPRVHLPRLPRLPSRRAGRRGSRWTRGAGGAGHFPAAAAAAAGRRARRCAV